MMRGLLLYTFVVAIFIGGCNDNPKWLLSEKKMQVVIADIVKLDVYTKNFLAKDSQKNALEENAKMQLQVFALHSVTKDDFYRSYDYYMAKPKKIESILDSIINRVNSERLINRGSPTQDPHATKQYVEQ